MKYVDEFRNIKLAKRAIKKIAEITPRDRQLNFMEVCGTHTQSFYRFGLDKLLPANLKLIAGPGCPVCVSPPEYIDAAISLAQEKEVILLTFGDMLRVPGGSSSLEKERAKGADVRILYSPLDALNIAKDNPAKRVIFLAVGFETTAGAIALSILSAKKSKLKNLSFFSSLKLIPPAMDYLLSDRRTNLQGFLCPGHVSAIIGAKAYEPVVRKYNIGCCVTGFEPLDILEGIYLLLRQIKNKTCRVDNQYNRVVANSGNRRAQAIIKKVFRVSGADWRGIGQIPKSGLQIKKDLSWLDAGERFRGIYKSKAQSKKITVKEKLCRCGDVLKGLISPGGCPLFRRTCTPEDPIGPCMVSSEGACNAFYKYSR